MKTDPSTAKQPSLWCATVSHVDVPGTIPAFFFNESQPDKATVFKRFEDVAAADELRLSGMFDITAALSQKDQSREAFHRGAAQNDGSEKLWFAMLSHRKVPGTHVHIFCQEDEPTDEQIFAREPDVNSKVMKVDKVFDITRVLIKSDSDRSAVEMAYSAEFGSPQREVSAEPTATPARRRPRP